MARQRQILVTVTYNDLGCIIDTKAEPYEEPNLQRSCNNLATDAINRQAAIDAIKTSRYLVDAMEKIIRLPFAQPEPTLEQIEEYCHKRCLSIVDNALLHKYAQPEQRWIPASERLPENDKRVLATTAWGEVTIAERIYPPINDTCWFIHDGNTNATIDDVVAWMPLPESYKGE